MKQKYRGLVLLLFGNIICLAQTTESSFKSGDFNRVQITEISPHKIENEEEWFEFSVEGSQAIDISNWKISNGASVKKTFHSVKDQLHLGQGGEWLQGKSSFLDSNGTIRNEWHYTGSGSSVTLSEDALILLPNPKAFLWWEKSPISLPNNGGTIQIVDEDDRILDEITYPEGSSGTRDGTTYADTWNRHSEKPNTLFPLTFHKENQTFPHSKGEENLASPTFPEEITLLISEISPKADDAIFDFLELFVANAPIDGANLKYLEVKHNGTPLFFFDYDFIVQAGDFIIINFDNLPFSLHSIGNIHHISTDKKDGLSSGSGTVEIILYSGTAWEAREDFLCWQKDSLSQTESNRVERVIREQNWKGSCYDISDIITNESIARASFAIDSDTKNDFISHFNGSKGKENKLQNHPPQAKIVVQGARRIFKSSLNFTGDESNDPDGKHDLKNFLWKVNGTQCSGPEDGWYWTKECLEESTRQNPNSIQFSKRGEYTVSLTVTDFSGAEHTTQVIIEVTENGINPFGLSASGGSSSAFDSSLRDWAKKEVQKKLKTPETKSLEVRTKGKNQYQASPDFFDTFLDHLPLDLLQKTPPELAKEKEYFEKKYLVERPRYRFQRDRFTDKDRKLIAKNLGFIYLK